MDELKAPLDSIKGIGPSTLRAFNRLGIFSVDDLLTTLPFRSEDRTKIVNISQLSPGNACVIQVKIVSTSARKSKNGVLIIQANVEDDSGKIPALWFNQRYLLRMLAPGRSYYLYGEKKLMKALGHPFFVKAIIDHPEIVPFYHSTAGISQNMWHRVVRQLKESIKNIQPLLPKKYAYNGETKSVVLERAHFDSSAQNIEQAGHYLGFEELVTLALSVLHNTDRSMKKTLPILPDVKFMKKVVESLPFTLTDGQRKTSWQIAKSFENGTAMRHLLYGEVGSGKTAVAIVVASSIVSARKQVVFLCPTVILANQQFETLRKIFEPLGVSVAQATGSAKSDGYTSSDIIVGTHALFESTGKFPRLGLVIVDEQHRFGVTQRQQLAEQGAHLLMMTATPIPRSLAQILFGQVTISYLLDKPKHQQPIKTYVFTETKRKIIEKDICERLKRGEQGYVICPLIVPSQAGSMQMALNDEQKTIQSEALRIKKVFPKYNLGILHGKLKPTEKDKVFQDFRDDRIDILLATTVVEVGVDNQNATWILIEQADCFGLSTLHQLRGRVGRGNKTSVCYLTDSETSEYGQKRLEVIKNNDNGLELAKQDLALRGPGELLGYEQSGLPSLRYASWQDTEKIKEAFAIAEKIVEDGLEKYPKLHKEVMRQAENSTFG